MDDPPKEPGTPPVPSRRAVLILLASAALGAGGAGLALRPGLPPLHQDEYLHLLPLTWSRKLPEARSSLLEGYSREVFGRKLPLRSYSYCGAVKTLPYMAVGLPVSPDTMRACQILLTIAVYLAALFACLQVSGWSLAAAVGCLGLLLADIPLQFHLIADSGHMSMGLLLALGAFGLSASLIQSPRLWNALALALVAFLGEWDKVNFLWYAGAALAGCAAAGLAGPPRAGALAAGVLSAACAAGIWSALWLIPSYRGTIAEGLASSLPLAGPFELLRHAVELMGLLDPFQTYHRYADVTSSPRPALYASYRVSFTLFYHLAAGCAALAAHKLRTSRQEARPLLFMAAFLPALLLAIVKTRMAWGAHHIVVIKPFAYIAFGALFGHFWTAPPRSAGRTGATLRFRFHAPGRRVWAALGGLALAFYFGVVGVLGFRDRQRAPPHSGVYGVSQNAVEAWQAAARSSSPHIYALDWGVFYPGVANSPPGQRWEMAQAKGLSDLLKLEAIVRGQDVGLLFKPSGEHAWLVQARQGPLGRAVAESLVFDNHRGESWRLWVVRTSLLQAPAVP